MPLSDSHQNIFVAKSVVIQSVSLMSISVAIWLLHIVTFPSINIYLKEQIQIYKATREYRVSNFKTHLYRRLNRIRNIFTFTKMHTNNYIDSSKRFVSFFSFAVMLNINNYPSHKILNTTDFTV